MTTQPTTRAEESAAHGFVWVECPDCNGTGSIFAPDGSGQAWCTTCQHGEGGWDARPEEVPA